MTRQGQVRNQLRIIGGKWRGRKLDFPDAEGLRPTGDRIRETLFNWLRPHIVAARCLDLFAGSGALGFEALSQGAGKAVLLEANSKVVDSLNHNAQILSANNATIVKTDCLCWLASQSAEAMFDLVFIDAPFASNLLAPSIQAVEEVGILADNALIYIETPRDHFVAIPPSWRRLQSKSTGQVTFALYQHTAKLDELSDNGEVL